MSLPESILSYLTQYHRFLGVREVIGFKTYKVHSGCQFQMVVIASVPVECIGSRFLLALCQNAHPAARDIEHGKINVRGVG